MNEELQVVESGMKIHTLIRLLEDLYSKDITERDKWWVMKTQNIVDTLELHSGRKYLYLQDEIINTEERLNLNHPIQRNFHV